MVSLPAESHIHEAIDPKEFAIRLAKWADDKKAENIRLYDVNGLCSYAGFILVCSGNSERHVMAIRDELRRQSKAYRFPILGSEGHQQANWTLVDFGDVVVHVFFEPVREYYELDRIWSEAPRVELDLQTTASSKDNDEEDEEDW